MYLIKNSESGRGTGYTSSTYVPSCKVVAGMSTGNSGSGVRKINYNHISYATRSRIENISFDACFLPQS
jgi:hypothetical protein